MFDVSKQPSMDSGMNSKAGSDSEGGSRLTDMQKSMGNAAVQMQSGRSRLTGPSGRGSSILRDGAAIPGGAQIERVDGGSPDAIVSAVQNAAAQCAGGYGSDADFRSSPIAGIIEDAFANKLATRSIPINWKSPGRGLFGKGVNWSGTINFRIGAENEVSGGGTGSVQSGSGGTSSRQIQNTTAQTDSAKLTGSAKGGDPKDGGEFTGGGEVSTATTNTAQTTVGSTVNSTDTSTSNRVLRRYSASLSASIYLTGTLDFSGSDYVNPFAWGMRIGESIAPFQPVNTSAPCGTVFYYKSDGIAPSR